MKKIIKEFYVYTFEELSEKAKQNAIKHEKYSENYLDYNWWDCIFENFRTKFKQIGIDDADFKFQLSYTQGDYAKITEGVCNETKIIPNIRLGLDKYLNVLFVNNVVIVEPIIYEYDYHRIYAYLTKIAQQIEDAINNAIRELNDSLYKALQKEYEYLTSDECISQILISNEYLFYEDGTIYQY